MNRILFLFLSILFSFSSMAQSIKPFESGDRVVFVGNSITDGGRYHSFVWLYYMTRFPEKKFQIYNAGISADMVSNMQKRFETDVLPHKPTYILLTFGMNDSGYSGYDKPDREEYASQMVNKTFENYAVIEDKILNIPKINVGIMTASPYDENVGLPNNSSTTAHKGKTNAMIQIADFQQKQAQKNDWGFVDVLRPMLLINQEGQKSDSTFTISGGDRVHPGTNGHMIMAYLFLKAQGFEGNKVADFVIDAKTNKSTLSENCKISNIQHENAKLSFNYLANSLPFPTDTLHLWGSPSQRDGLKHIPFMDEMNQELLKIKKLTAGKYQLLIDGETIGEFSSDILSSGINLADYTQTPQYQQAMSVMLLNEERWEIERRLRQYKGLHYRYLEAKGLLFEDSRKTLDQLQSELNSHYMLPHLYPNYTKAMFPEIRKTWEMMQDLLVDRIYTINKPIERVIEIHKIK